ncbi:hypothetical protein J4446_03435 [Candidatus Woesearchaeota archaeon]|nr:hypothetical protein [Candidatus Woesearchaeota archaeon]
MPKINQELLKSAPSPNLPSYRIISMLFAFLIFTILIYVGSVTYTGLAINDLNNEEITNMENQNILVSNRFEILEVTKTPNSALNVNMNSDISVNIFAEIDDCSFWKNGRDRDNSILYSVNEIKKGNFKIGNPSEDTMQQVDLYKTDYLCLILINKEFPKTGNANIQYYETDVNKWRIV